MNLRRTFFTVLVGTLALGLVSCDSDYERFGDRGPVTPSDPVGASEWVLDVNVDGTSATYSTEEMAEGTGPAPSIVAARQIVRGGSLVMAITVEDTAEELYVGVANADFGYYRFDLSSLPSAVVDEQFARAEARRAKELAAGVAPRAAARAPREVWVNLTSHPDFNGTGFTAQVATATGGVMSEAVNHVITVNSVAAASSQLQVSLNWVHPVDMDLHVEMPDGFNIFFAAQEGDQGGELDLDSNPACFLDLIQNENITWRDTAPISGEYVVRVHLWSACDATEAMPYIVTVRRGEQVDTFEGNFVPADDGTSPREITRFTMN